MDKAKLNEMKEFLRPSFRGILGACVLVVLIFFCASEFANPAGAVLMFGAIAVGIMIPDIMKFSRWRSFFSNKALVEEALQDFSNGVFLGDNSICMGKKYMIGRRACAAYAYKDAVHVYEYVHKTNMSVDNRELKIRTRDDDLYTLCVLPKQGLSQDSTMKIFLIIKTQNPSVRLGYK